MSLKFVILVSFVFCAFTVKANEPVALGQWRIHLPYKNAHSICETHEKIYCASDNGLFAYHKIENTVERLSSINGFSGYKVEAMAFDWASSTLIIAYEDCRIDLVRGNSIEKNDDIFRKTIIGEKIIYHIQISNGMAYIGTSFGLLELNFAKNEIRNSYQNIGPAGTVIDIYSSAVLNDSLYIGTKTGIYSGSMNPNVNLADYTNWYLSKPCSLASRYMASFNGKLFAELDSQLYSFQNNTWLDYKHKPGKRIVTNIDVNHGKLVIGSFGNDSIMTLDENGVHSGVKINILNKCLLDQQGLFWYSSPGIGLINMQSGGEINFTPNGPNTINAYQFLNAYGNLWVMAGGFISTNFSPTFNGNKYSYFDNFNWTHSPENPFTYPLYDYTVASYQQANGRLYIGTHGKGLLQINDGNPVKIYDQSNSPLTLRGGLFCIIRGLASDKNNNLWISNYDGDSALRKLSPTGLWTSFKSPVQTLGKIVIDSRGNKWILARGSSVGIVAFSDNGSNSLDDDIFESIGINKGGGNLPTSVVNDIAFTRSGELLIGTDQGYVKIRNPNNIFSGGDYDAQRVIVSVEANSNLGGYLLGSEVINCITIDGGDRRWFGTNKGAWLFDSDGETLIHHFTKENSPLMSDNVLSIGIMESNGEVFFGTDRGIASFRSDAITESKHLTDLIIYPNPVKPDYDGPIAITGMPDKTLVKITDINGSLVNQTFSNGGMATWDGKTFDGTRVSTGIYLVFCINTEGTETMAGKILFIH